VQSGSRSVRDTNPRIEDVRDLVTACVACGNILLDVLCVRACSSPRHVRVIRTTGRRDPRLHVIGSKDNGFILQPLIDV
jgi:hypothetical protein